MGNGVFFAVCADMIQAGRVGEQSQFSGVSGVEAVGVLVSQWENSYGSVVVSCYCEKLVAETRG
jgi:hypothetical protein